MSTPGEERKDRRRSKRGDQEPPQEQSHNATSSPRVEQRQPEAAVKSDGETVPREDVPILSPAGDGRGGGLAEAHLDHGVVGARDGVATSGLLTPPATAPDDGAVAIEGAVR